LCAQQAAIFGADRLKDGKFVRDARRLSVPDRLRQVGSKRVRVVHPSLPRLRLVK
jgi:hypothetical protein